jgi:histone acetyltransferase MYST1
MPLNKSDNIGVNTTSLSIYEILGSESKLYCQNLSLLSKLFLDHKSIYFDVSPFKFYIITENDEENSHFVGYFSKELSSLSDFNLACIMVLPPFQKNGYGQFLISLSYYFSKKEAKISTPEVPLSDLGRLSYKSYWTITLLELLVKSRCNLTLKELSEISCIKYEDIIYTLSELNLIKYWKGQQVLQSINQRQLEDFLKKKKSSKQHHVKFNPDYFL